MATLTKLATSYTYSDVTYSNPAYAYTDTSSTTYAGINFSSVTGYMRYTTFDFSEIPDGSAINSVTFKVKAANTATSGTMTVKAYINGVEKASWSHTGTLSATVDSSVVSSGITLANIKASAANNYFEITETKTGLGPRIYGFEIIVDYYDPTSYDLKRAFHDMQNQIYFGGL